MLAGVVLAALAVPAEGASGARKLGAAPPLSHDGRWITDARGRVVILHGVNMVYKRPPYDPSAIGFGADDAAFLRRHGFNNVRLGTIYSAVEPQPATYDDAYLERIAATTHVLAAERIYTMLDFHQDLYNERFGGEGFPDWAVLDDGLPAQPLTGFPLSYVTSPGLNRAFDNLWANAPGPGGVPLQDRYAAAWGHVAERFAGEPYLLGYDLINEPWPGTQWPTCANFAGCPVFEQQFLAPTQQRAINAIRQADSRGLVWYEPMVITNFGARHNHPDTGDPWAGLSFHIYCLGADLAPLVPEVAGMSCDQLEELALENAEERAAANGDTLLLSEFGATDDPATITRMVDRADSHMVGWQWWHYCNCDDPTTTGPGDKQAIVSDPAQPPSGANVLGDKLALIVRPYPQTVAGTPRSYSFDRDTRTFELAYSTASPSGERLERKIKTQVFVPELHYPDGYRAEVRGARVMSDPDAAILVLQRTRSADEVELTVTPR
jgi:endoglycosylceramidase